MTKLTVEQLKVIINTGIDPDSEAATQIIRMVEFAARAKSFVESIKGFGYLDSTDKAEIDDLSSLGKEL